MNDKNKIIIVAIIFVILVTSIIVIKTDNDKEIGTTKEEVEVENMENDNLVWGSVKIIDETSFSLINDSKSTTNEEIILTTSNETVIVDAVSGLPLSLDSIDNSLAYAYIGSATTRSIPPKGTANIVIANIPQDYLVPSFITIDKIVESNKDGVVFTVENMENEFTITSETTLLSHLNRKVPKYSDIKTGAKMLIWRSVSAKTKSPTNEIYQVLFLP